MQKVIIRRPGGYGRLELVEEKEKPLGPGEARVRTVSVGVNFADCVVRLGLYPAAAEYVGWPITPGFEFSGVIEELHESSLTSSKANPRQLKVGDEVLGVVRFGAYSSSVNAPLTQLFPVPSGISLKAAGILPVASLTAWYALRELGAAAQGKKVLVHSAAGGVGGAAVQIAKALGCTVVAVVGSSQKVEVARAHGADHVIDKSHQALFPTAEQVCPGGFDLVLDANGAETMRNSYRALRPTGRLILYGAHSMLPRGKGKPNWFKLAWDFLRTPRFMPLDMINDNKSVMAFNLSYLFEEQDLLQAAFEHICALYADGTLRLPEIQEFPLADVALAHAALQSGSTTGKLTLIP